jgi:glycosyltransferase involved in cell wall biosynthesis
MLAEVGYRLDMNRIHFLGQIPYEFHLNLLQISSAHVYLTFPFVLSWSFLEAMASGCAIIGSDTPPVMEVLQDGVNGLAVDFFSPLAVADRVDEILDHPTRMAHLRRAARATAIRDYDLHSKALPRWMRLTNDLIAGRKPLLFAA